METEKLDISEKTSGKGKDFVLRLAKDEQERQRSSIELIPSENYTYREVRGLLGSAFTNKYAEGYPGSRYYGGQQNTDDLEAFAVEQACRVFRSEHANVQPLSGSPMNQAVYFGLLNPGDKILAMDLSHGGHLTHGAPVSHMHKVFDFVRYKTDLDRGGVIDYDEVKNLAKTHQPQMILCGTSSYPLEVDYSKFKEIADIIGAITMADVSHVGGLIAGNALKNPMDAGFDVMTTTSHKTLRGPRGGIILCRKKIRKKIDAGVFPGLQGGPHMNNIAGIAYTLVAAQEAEFSLYCDRVLKNASAMVDRFIELGCQVVCGKTENHLTVINTVSNFGLTGVEAQGRLEQHNVIVNKQVLPDDPRSPADPSGIRLGSPACTTRGFDKVAFKTVSDLIFKILNCGSGQDVDISVVEEVDRLTKTFPEIDA